MKLLTTFLASFSLFAFSPIAAVADTYEVSAGMSYVIFKVRHFGTTNAYGRFNEFSGKIIGYAEDPAKASINFEVTAASIDTGIEKRDAHLRGPDFFNSKEFPKITFKTTAVAKTDTENVYKLTGDLTMLGVTKSVTADFTYFGTGTGPKKNPIAGGEAVFTAKRTDFGMEYGAPDAIGDEVTITVSLMGDKVE